MEKMFNFLYETNTGGSYIVLKVEEGIELLRYQVDMIISNNVPQLLPLHLRQEDGEVYINYYITSKQSLQKLLERKKMTINQLLVVMHGVCRGLLEANRFLLYETSCLFNYEYLYVNPVSFEVSMLYMPFRLEKVELIKELRILFNKLLLQVSEEEGSSSNYLHRIFLEINKEDFSIPQLQKEINEIRVKMNLSSDAAAKELGEEPCREALKGTGGRYKASESLLIIEDNKELRLSKGFKREGLLLILSQILMVVISGLLVIEDPVGIRSALGFDWGKLIGLLLVLGVFDYLVIKRLLKSGLSKVNSIDGPIKRTNNIKTPNTNNLHSRKEKLFKNAKTDNHQLNSLKSDNAINKVNRQKENAYRNDTQFVRASEIAFLSINKGGISENISIKQPSFIIGKLTEQVDYVIDKNTISRLHAEIIFEGGIYSIKDLNSKNGTFLNGERIESNKDYQLSNGDVITLADQSMVFHTPSK